MLLICALRVSFNLLLNCALTIGMPPHGMDDSDDEFEVLEGMNIGIPECKGLPRRRLGFGIRSVSRCIAKMVFLLVKVPVTA